MTDSQQPAHSCSTPAGTHVLVSRQSPPAPPLPPSLGLKAAWTPYFLEMGLRIRPPIFSAGAFSINKPFFTPNSDVCFGLSEHRTHGLWTGYKRQSCGEIRLDGTGAGTWWPGRAPSLLVPPHGGTKCGHSQAAPTRRSGKSPFDHTLRRQTEANPRSTEFLTGARSSLHTHNALCSSHCAHFCFQEVE